MTRRNAVPGGWLLLAVWISACGGSTASSSGSPGADAATDTQHFDLSDATATAEDVTVLDAADGSGTKDAVAADLAPLDTGPKLGCGDNLCTSPETTISCPTDCKKPICGDGFCQTPESGMTCELDCAPEAVAEVACIKKLCPSAVTTCSQDVTCAGLLGTALMCASDANGDTGQLDFCAQNLANNPKSKALIAPSCGFAGCASKTTGAICGDGLCQPTESSASCGYDCLGVAGKCGDGACTGSETNANCPSDCATASVCGDGTCQPGEDSGNCPADCPVVAVCGDGVCDTTENASKCALDCDAALKAKADCLKAQCGGEFDACSPDPACIAAITAGLQCAAKCTTGDVICLLGCQSSLNGVQNAQALASCSASKCP